MNSKKHLTIFLTISVFFTSCASFSMGQRYCEAPVLPTKPVIHRLIAGPGSTAIFNGQIVDITNYIAISPDDDRYMSIWQNDVVNACTR